MFHLDVVSAVDQPNGVGIAGQRQRKRLCPHLLFVLFAGFLTLPTRLATQTEAALMKSVRPAGFSSATTMTTEESVLRNGDEIGSGAACHGPVKAFHVPLILIPRRNSGIFAETGHSFVVESGVELSRNGIER